MYFAHRKDLDKWGDSLFYEYLRPQTAKSNPSVKEYFFIIIELNELTFKKCSFNTEGFLSGFKDYLIIPRNINYRSFTAIENQLARIKDEPVFQDISFEKIFGQFIEDLYVNNYFKEASDVISIKASLEYVPMINGIIHKVLYDHYYNFCYSVIEDKKELKEYYFEKFQDIYIGYTRFLASQNTERLYLPGKWFVKDEEEHQKKCFDKVLYDTESRYQKICKILFKDKQLERKFGLNISNNTTIRLILKRYGVTDVLRLSMPEKWMISLFAFILSCLIFFILLDVAEYNLTLGIETFSNFHRHLRSFTYYGLYSSVALFSIYSLILPLFVAKYKSIVPGIYLPRMVIAIMSGWVIFLTGEELIKIDINLKFVYLIGLFVMIVVSTIIFMIFEINNYAPAMFRPRILYRSLVVGGLAFVVSYAFGFWVMTFVNEKFMSYDSFLVNMSDVKTAYKERKNDVEYLFQDVVADTTNKNIVLDNLLQLSVLDSSKENNLYREGILNRANDFNMAFSEGSGSKMRLMRAALKDYLSGVNSYYSEIDNEEMFENYLKELQKIEIGGKTIYAKNYPLNPFKYESASGRVICTFPNMLLSRALIAMFIGIFFQLIIQDKTITEPI